MPSNHGLFRNPRGAFISRESMLFSWLPDMLDWHYRGAEALATMLMVAARWCERQAAQAHERAAQCLSSWESDSPQFRKNFAESRSMDAQHWIRRGEILRETVARLAEVPNA